MVQQKKKELPKSNYFPRTPWPFLGSPMYRDKRKTLHCPDCDATTVTLESRVYRSRIDPNRSKGDTLLFRCDKCDSLFILNDCGAERRIKDSRL